MKLELNGRNLRCAVGDCPFRRECAQHDTAGDFRSEDGFSPQIEKVGDDYICKTRDAEVDIDHRYGVVPVGHSAHGFVYISKKGDLVGYEGVYEEMQ